jgi:ketosteroid isomerase-like protein
MSRENVEVVRRLYDEWGEGRFGTALHLFDPGVEYTRSGIGEGSALGLTGEWRGLEAMTRAALEWIQTFDRLRVQAERFIEAGDSVVIFTRHRGNAKESGLPIEAEFADVLTLRDGLVVRLDQYRDRDEALEAVGLRE